MQLTRLAVVAAIVAGTWSSPPARADGELAVRGAYYKEKATRVQQPMLDARFDVGDSGEVTGHMLLDAISSASVAAGASGEPFDETRVEAGAGYTHTFNDIRVGGSVRYSREPDYRSLFAVATGAYELAQNNATLSLALARGLDDIDNSAVSGRGTAPRVEGQLDTTLASMSLTQILSPQVIAGVTYDFSLLDGTQENLYRTVIAGGIAEPERVPDARIRHAVFGSVRAYVPATRSTIVAGHRYYTDDWGIDAHTPELRITQTVTREIWVRARYRYHTQTATEFYQELYDTGDPQVQPYLTDDPKLGAFSTHTAGGLIGCELSLFGLEGQWGLARVEALFEHIWQSNRFGDAVVAEVALTVPFRY